MESPPRSMLSGGTGMVCCWCLDPHLMRHPRTHVQKTAEKNSKLQASTQHMPPPYPTKEPARTDNLRPLLSLRNAHARRYSDIKVASIYRYSKRHGTNRTKHTCVAPRPHLGIKLPLQPGDVGRETGCLQRGPDGDIVATPEWVQVFPHRPAEHHRVLRQKKGGGGGVRSAAGWGFLRGQHIFLSCVHTSTCSIVSRPRRLVAQQAETGPVARGRTLGRVINQRGHPMRQTDV